MTNQRVYRVPDEEFKRIIASSKNVRQALITMKLKPKGGNYDVIKKRCSELGIPLKITPTLQTEKYIRREISNDDVIIWCKNATSRAGALKRLNLKPAAGSNIRWIDERIKTLNINTKHWLGQGYLKDKTHDWSKKIPIAELLVKDSHRSTGNIKRRLIKEGLIKNECKKCGILEWCGQTLSLHLDHINGQRTDNRFTNLRLLCPNCHSLTDTYCGKNKSNTP